MPRPLLALLLAALSLPPLSGCAPAVNVPDDERLRVTQEWEGRTRWLRVAVYVGPLFGDASRALASDQPFGELDLLETPGGRTISPPRPERVVAPGTRLVVRSVEFPTPWRIASRVLLTPRYHAWAVLELPGEARPVVLVLPQNVATAEQVKVELERYLATFDPGPDLAALSEGQRKAIERKEITEGMGPQAVTMAWGYPEKRVVDRPAGKELWTWPGGKRRAWLEDERLVRFETR
ncbi:MAG: hypothetical protein HZB56_16250 [Deltaproteobacteria bacterium]|nr:hypothetical protein [Deltaproteobacteria bacterium]